MRLKKIFASPRAQHTQAQERSTRKPKSAAHASPRAQHTQAQERSGGEGSYYAYLQIVIYP